MMKHLQIPLKTLFKIQQANLILTHIWKYHIVSNKLKKMQQKESNLKTNQEALRILQIVMTVLKVSLILKIKLRKYMKKSQKAQEQEANDCGTKKVKNH